MKARPLFVAEVALAVTFALITLATFLRPDWIELVFGAEPDRGGGEAEWWIAAVLGLITVGLSVLARIEWRRTQQLGNKA